MEDNTIAVINRTFRYFSIPVTDERVEILLRSHSAYPSLKSVSDLLRRLKIEHDVLRITEAELLTVDRPFIAHLSENSGQLTFVQSLGGSQVKISTDSRKTINLPVTEFKEKWSGVVIILYPGELSGEKEYAFKSQSRLLRKFLTFSTFFLFIGLAAYFSLFKADLQWPRDGLILLVKALGLSLALLLLFRELKIGDRLTSKICQIKRKLNCDAILESSASKIFGWISWSDIGVIYFSGSLLIFIWGDTLIRSYLSVCTILAVTFVPFSIYYQALKVKKWCPLCLVIQVGLVVEALFFIKYVDQVRFEWDSLIPFVLILFVLATTYLLGKLTVLQQGLVARTNLELQIVKRDPGVFMPLWRKNAFHAIDESNALFIGSESAPISIHCFLSLRCTACKSVFEDIACLVGAQSGKVNARLTFSVQDDELSEKAISILYHLNEINEWEEIVDFLNAWYREDFGGRKALLVEKNKRDQWEQIESIKEANNLLFSEHKISATPTVFVNGRKLPNVYSVDELSDFFVEIEEVGSSSVQPDLV